jgi:hypothetical protein
MFRRRDIVIGGMIAAAAAAAVALWYTSRPVAPNTPPLHFADVTETAGIAFRHFNGATGKKLLPETMGSGVAIIDYDRHR